MTFDIWYTAVEQFSPADGESWSKYIAWSGLVQLTELISLDGMLCPPVIRELIDEDWRHNVHADNLCDYFVDLDYLLNRVRHFDRYNILAVSKEPLSLPALNNEAFRFCGFDLIESSGSVSALTNCGGFPESFTNSELSDLGLIRSLERAKKVQSSLRQNNPNEPHALCDVWAIWKMESNKRVKANAEDGASR